MRTYLRVPYAEKDSAKRAGARWDGEKRLWYVQDMDNLRPVMAWIPEALKRPWNAHSLPRKPESSLSPKKAYTLPSRHGA